MQVCLIGADFEENLALGMLAGVVAEAGHEPCVLPFNVETDAPGLVTDIMARAPDVVGLSIQFQHRADEFFRLASSLRRAGYRGHITAGGHFPTLAFAEALEGSHQLDSVVLHDGEQTLAELLAALEAGTALDRVAGLALLSDDGKAFRTAARPLIGDLDSVPHMMRYRPHTLHMGVPFIPMMGGRGCWGRCTFCSITAMYRDARATAGGRLLRHRSPEDVAAEMAALWHRAGGSGIFCFHDDNFLMPRPRDSLARVRALRAALDDYGVGDVAMMGKCRPETVTPELAEELADLGVIRLYVGVENTTEAGARHLGRSVQQRAVRAALAACREAGIFACYNLLIFEPDATIDDIRANVQFMREHAQHPVNFCRAEPYFGTLLQADVAKRQALSGDYLGWTYRLEDDRAELLYRICAAAFAERNFDAEGVANRYMSMGYAAKVIEHFHGHKPNAVAVQRRVRQLTRGITLDTASFLDRAMEIAETVPLDDWDACERRTGLLGLEVADADRKWHRELDEVLADMEALAASAPIVRQAPPPPRKPLPHKCAMAVGLTLAVAWSGCSEDKDRTPTRTGTVTGNGGFGNVYDMAPTGMGGTATGDGGFGGVYDMAPGGMGGTAPGGGGAGGGGTAGAGGDAGAGGSASRLVSSDRALASAGEVIVDQWRDTAAARVRRTRDLPLYDPPRASLTAERRDGAIVVRLEGDLPPCTTRWEAEGSTLSEGRQCIWHPQSRDERIRVGIRTRGGVAILSLRADEATCAT